AVHRVDIGKLTDAALHGSGLSTKEIGRSKNMFALGLMLWLYQRPMEPILRALRSRFAKQPQILEANEKVLRAGHAFGETAELFPRTFEVKPAAIEPGLYRAVSGNQALALGLVAAAKLSGLQGFYGSYPITPASDILHELAKHKNFGFTTFQAEDEIAAVSAAIGASFGGSLGITASSGPGIALKQEAINLAVMVELPLVVVDVQRGGPSTGLPTKTEQADLWQAIFGRNGESPVPVIAPCTPSDCFDAALEAARIAIRHMTPVFLLSDGSLANGQEPWRVPELAALQPIEVRHRSAPDGFLPYLRDDETLARPWAIPGAPGLEHRIGGLEKDARTGNVSYDPKNHEAMVDLRAAKLEKVAESYPPLRVDGPAMGELLVVGWGSTYGAIRAAVAELRQAGREVSHLHLRHLNPLPRDLGGILTSYKHIVVPELNRGQLCQILRGRYLVDARSISKVQGKPFQAAELVARIQEELP
ncbi:MAG TPA: 2-oxoacid:acceptor oxidoreductase subunit alpha, partial [Vulgatibacter sp.]